MTPTNVAIVSALNGLKQGIENGPDLPKLMAYDSSDVLISEVELTTPFGSVVETELVIDGPFTGLCLETGSIVRAEIIGASGDKFLDMTAATLDAEGQQVSDLVLDAESVFQGGNFNVNSIIISVV